jgi:hypothetical protein
MLVERMAHIDQEVEGGVVAVDGGIFQVVAFRHHDDGYAARRAEADGQDQATFDPAIAEPGLRRRQLEVGQERHGAMA